METVKVEALRGVNLRAYRGDFVAVLGPSGCGKSTLLNMMGALDSPTSGEVIIDGAKVSEMNSNQLAEIRLEKVGFVFQFFNLLSRYTALQNVELKLMMANMGSRQRSRRAVELLGQVGLSHRVHHRPFEMSGGEQQRVAIARALANNPQYILCDEPTGNLDRQTGQEIVNLLKKINVEESTTFVMVTHDPSIAEVANRIIYMVDGVVQKEDVG